MSSLPPLPEPDAYTWLSHDAWTANAVRAYGEACAAAEREACARAIEQYGGAWDVTTQNFARVIRARGET